MSLLGLFSAACNLSIPLVTTPEAATPTSETGEEPIPEALVTFQVRLPPNTPLREPVYLNLLDEVTGLALNVERHEMQAADDFNFEVTIPIPLGATIQYRYARQANYLAEEHTSDKRPVRYRLLHVEGPVRVQDVVSAWSDTAFTGPTGRIRGTATDAERGSPLPNLLVTAGGAQALTTSDGSFLLEGLPPGTHNLVAYAIDGSYRTFQQGAVVAEESTTPAPIRLQAAQPVRVVFTLTAPQGTMPAVPIRMAGNLYQLGNTFANLAGGMNTMAARMPVLTPLPDGRYSTALDLPAGAHVIYKYTLGDGFWNAEHRASGGFHLRHLIVPETETVVEDRVDSWGGGSNGPVLFDVTVPAGTPAADFVSIQFNPYGWTEPIPMWKLGENHWVYVLYSPLAGQEKLGYRYCRNDQCGSADDFLTPGSDHLGRVVELAGGQQTVNDNIADWNWLAAPAQPAEVASPPVRTRGLDFIAGVEFQPAFHPSWTPRMPAAFKEVQEIGANWVVLTPTWTFTRQAPLVLELVTGRNPLWPDLADDIRRARSFNLNVALFPTPQFPLHSNEWWAGAPRDFAWWVQWFERYRGFALHHADLAYTQGAQSLILGGEWVNPALPGGLLANGDPSGVPADAEERWRSLLDEVRAKFDGQLLWAMPFAPGGLQPPPFLDKFDGVYLLWSAPLSEAADASEQDLHARAAAYLDEEVQAFQAQVGKPVVLAVSYTSADGAATACLPDPLNENASGCLDLGLLERPYADIPPIALDLDEQARAYSALLVAINERDWIAGFVSRGFYPPAALQDKSPSVHGKPAAQALEYWYPRLVGKPPDGF